MLIKIVAHIILDMFLNNKQYELELYDFFKN